MLGDRAHGGVVNAAKSGSKATQRQENVSVSGWKTVKAGCTRSHTAGAPASSRHRRNSSRLFTIAASAQICATYVRRPEARTAATKSVTSTSTVSAYVHGDACR